MKISEFEASLVYRVSFRTTRATQRNLVSKKKKKKKNPTIKYALQCFLSFCLLDLVWRRNRGSPAC